MHFMKISSVLCVDYAAFSETCGPRNRTCLSDSHLLHILYKFIPQCIRHICWNPGDHSGYITHCIRSTPRGDTFDLPLRKSQGTYDSWMLVFTLYRLHCMLIVFGKQSFFKSTWHLLHEIFQDGNLTQSALSIWHDVLIEQPLCYFRFRRCFWFLRDQIFLSRHLYSWCWYTMERGTTKCVDWKPSISYVPHFVSGICCFLVFYNDRKNYFHSSQFLFGTWGGCQYCLSRGKSFHRDLSAIFALFI